MAVAFDAVSSASVANNAGTTLSWTHTPVASPPSSVGVALQFYNDASMSVTGVTYGGQALTKLATSTSGSVGGFSSHTEIWGSDGLTLPSGAQTVVITASATGNYIEAGAITVTGSNTTTCFSNGANASDVGGSTTATVTCTSATGELVMDIAGTANQTVTNSGTQTSRWSQSPGFFVTAGSTQAGAATDTSTWTLSGSVTWCMSAASFKAASGGGGFFARAYYDLSGARNV
jgi:hypothetical protein